MVRVQKSAQKYISRGGCTADCRRIDNRLQGALGECNATPHWKYKSSSFNGGINVPLIVRYPLHDYICWEHRGKCAILKGNWRMVFDNSNQQWTLYDLTCHGGVEVEDLSARSPQKVEDLFG